MNATAMSNSGQDKWNGDGKLPKIRRNSTEAANKTIQDIDESPIILDGSRVKKNIRSNRMVPGAG